MHCLGSGAHAPRRQIVAKADRVVEVLRHIQDDRFADLRDRAILSLGMASGLRCSGQAVLDVADLTAEARGLRATIRPSKTDQASCGIKIAVPSGAAVARTRRHQGRPRVPVFVDQRAPCARLRALRPECHHTWSRASFTAHSLLSDVLI